MEGLQERALPHEKSDTADVITVSCGIAQMQAGDTPEMLIERADQALYQAKDQGRNRYVCAE